MRTFVLAAVAAVLCGVADRANAGIQASADITSGAGTYYPYQYQLTLHNTGDTNIGTFWFAWDDSGLNFLPSYPYFIQGPGDWVGTTTGTYLYTGGGYLYSYGIEWNTTGAPLTPGDSLPGFSFESYDSPDVLAGISNVPPVNPGDAPFPVGTSFVYESSSPVVGVDPGFQFVAGGTVPEPAALGFLGAGLVVLLARRGTGRRT